MKTRECAGFVHYSTWNDVMNDAKCGEKLYYWPPLNYRPMYFGSDYNIVGDSLRMIPPRYDEHRQKQDPFIADSGHLERFMKRVIELK